MRLAARACALGSFRGGLGATRPYRLKPQSGTCGLPNSGDLPSPSSGMASVRLQSGSDLTGGGVNSVPIRDTIAVRVVPPFPAAPGTVDEFKQPQPGEHVLCAG